MSKENVFSGLKVVEMASYIAGPGAATILSDFGAEVVKVEPPGSGDPHRQTYKIPPVPASKENYPFQLANRNRRGMAVDLKSPRAREIIERLVKWADVLIINYPQPVRKRLKLTYEDVSAWNPRLIYADLTGFGDEGPDAELPGFDVTSYWARAGLLAMTRDAGSPPTFPVPGSGDHATAVGLYSAIVTGLFRRERSGRGSYVTTSLLAEGVWAMGMWTQAALCGAKFYTLHDRKSPTNPLTNPYQASDGNWLFLFVVLDKDWPAAAKALGRSELALDARFTDGAKRAANARQLAAILDETFVTQPLKYWRAKLDEARVTYGLLQTPYEVIDDPQMRVNDIIVPFEGRGEQMKLTVSSPLNIHGVSKVTATRAPELGEHNDEVLRELGFAADQIDGLRAAGAIPAVPDLKKAAAGAGGR
jgi:formyl-CoA transferase